MGFWYLQVFMSFRTGGHLNRSHHCRLSPLTPARALAAFPADKGWSCSVTGSDVARLHHCSVPRRVVGAVLCWLTFRKHFDELRSCSQARYSSLPAEFALTPRNCVTGAIGAPSVLWSSFPVTPKPRLARLALPSSSSIICNSLGGPTSAQSTPLVTSASLTQFADQGQGWLRWACSWSPIAPVGAVAGNCPLASSFLSE